MWPIRAGPATMCPSPEMTFLDQTLGAASPCRASVLLPLRGRSGSSLGVLSSGGKTNPCGTPILHLLVSQGPWSTVSALGMGRRGLLCAFRACFLEDAFHPTPVPASTRGVWTFPVQGSNPRHSSDHAGSLTHRTPTPAEVSQPSSSIQVRFRLIAICRWVRNTFVYGLSPPPEGSTQKASILSMCCWPSVPRWATALQKNPRKMCH